MSRFIRDAETWPLAGSLLVRALIPAYSIQNADMQPVTKIRIFGIRLAVAVTALYWILLFVGTHVPNVMAGAVAANVNDKVKHFSAFFILGALMCYVTNSDRWLRRFATIGLIGMTYAAIDEMTQRFVPGRYPDWMDFIADTAGLWTAIALYVLAKLAYKKGEVAG